MERVLNIAVVGCGYWGPNLIRNFNSLPSSQVKVVCDKDPDRLAYIRRQYPGTQTTTAFENVVNDKEIDAVAIATPVNSHFELTTKSLLAGKHTFVEKPMASSSAQCRIMNELAQKEQLTLMVGHTFLFTAAVRKIKEIIKSGEIGEICYISSRRLNLGLFQKDINVAWDLAPHDISIILYAMDDVPISVNCQGKAHITNSIEDVTNMTLDFSNGGFATIHSSWLDPNKVREMKFVGTKKMIVYDDIEPLEKIKIYDKRVEVPPHYDTFGEFQYSYHYGDMYVPHLDQAEPLKAECEHFINCALNGEKPISGGREGLQIVQILESASESLRSSGKAVLLEHGKRYPMRNVAQYS